MRAQEWATQLQETVRGVDFEFDVSSIELLNLDKLKKINAASLWQALQESELPDRQAFDPLFELVSRYGLELVLLHLALALIVVCIVVQRWQTIRMNLYYQPASTRFNSFIRVTNIMSMEYRPWIGALNVHMQGFVFVIIELWTDLCFSLGKKQVYEREIFELSDGGEIALDWLIHTQKHYDSQRNIIVVVPGINGDSSKPYVLSLVKACMESNHDLVVVNWRGMGGVPLKVSLWKISVLTLLVAKSL